MKIASVNYTISLWVLSVVLPVVASVTIVINIFLSPRVNLLGVIGGMGLALLIVSFAYCVSIFARSLVSHLSYDKSTQALSGNGCIYPRCQVVACRLKKRPNLSCLDFEMENGRVLRCIPRFALYYDIKQWGAEDWWFRLDGVSV